MFLVFFFFFNDTATTEIYTLSLHDALPIYRKVFETLAASQTVEKLIGLPCCWRLWMASRVRSLACSLFCAARRITASVFGFRFISCLPGFSNAGQQEGAPQQGLAPSP